MIYGKLPLFTLKRHFLENMHYFCVLDTTSALNLRYNYDFKRRLYNQDSDVLPE